MSAAAVSQICFLQDLKRQIQIAIGSLLHDTQWQVTGGAEKTVQLLLFCVLERYLVYRYFHRRSALVLRGFESLG